jgi:hypothetical protein
MKANVLSGLPFVVLALIAVPTTGCTHNTLSSGAEDLGMTYTPDPSGAGRFERGSVIVANLQALPADPAEAALYGTERLLLRFTPFTADLTSTTAVAFSDITLSQGTYNVTRIELSPLTLVDTDVAINPPVCIDGVAVIDGSQPAGIPTNFIFLNPPSLTFTVHPGQTQLALTVNVPGMIAGYTGAYTCSTSAATCSPRTPPCLTAFDQNAYRNTVLANLSIK